MAQAYRKPFKSVADQISLLKARGMLISDDVRAATYLERVGYYRLSGYWYAFRASTPTHPKAVVHDDFRPDAEFEHVIQLYVFDKRLRLLMLDGIERLEVALRTKIALLLGGQSPTAHREPRYLRSSFVNRVSHKTGNTLHLDWLRRLDKAFGDSREDFVEHFRTHYNSQLPIWIAIELWDFGMLSHFLKGMRATELDQIARQFGIPQQAWLPTWVRSINFVRNLCAHHCRLWNRALVDQPAPPHSGSIPLLDHLVADNHALTRLYGTAAIIRYMLRAVNPTTTWGERLGLLVDSFPKVPGLSIRHMGFPSNWQSHALWP